MAYPNIPLDKLGQISQGITPSRYASDDGKIYHILSIGDLENLYMGDVQQKSQLNVPDIQRYQLLENDVVIAIRGALLKSSVVTAAAQGSVSNQNTVFFRSNCKQVNPLYLAVLLRSNYFEQMLISNRQRSTTTLQAIRVSEIRSLEVPLPDLSTQNQLAQLFLSIEKIKQVTLSTNESRQRLADVALFQTLGVSV